VNRRSSVTRHSTVRAAGGIVWRPGPGGATQVALVHRPLQDDWTLPKGKMDAGETPEQCALREVEEETGLRCRIDRPAGCTAYVDRRGRDKIVCYWIMRPLGGRFQPGAEVDEMCWLTVEQALRLLTYPIDRALLSAQELPDTTRP
jgi:8-oxo-dGTP pyrophosphatase MutT (NUDIX family)